MFPQKEATTVPALEGASAVPQVPLPEVYHPFQGLLYSLEPRLEASKLQPVSNLTPPLFGNKMLLVRNHAH